ncbi:MAG: hypothetical protein JWP19_580 [Rhodoglobus sp.]|nr:hypothetical protein [Rhodoglobus sp.]
MSTFRNPVGPQPSRVYWRRRLALLLGLLAVIIVVVLIVARPPSGSPTPVTSGTNSASPGVTPTATSTNVGDAKACDPAKVTVTAGLDSNSYAAGVNPALSFSLKNTSPTACTFSAGSDVQEFHIVSGDELIWNSKDCQTGAVAATVLLQPFVPFAGSSLSWDRTRSSKDTCNVARDQVIAGGASYHLIVIVNAVQSDNPQFILQ